jgi:hypothetical protein
LLKIKTLPLEFRFAAVSLLAEEAVVPLQALAVSVSKVMMTKSATMETTNKKMKNEEKLLQR